MKEIPDNTYQNYQNSQDNRRDDSRSRREPILVTDPSQLPMALNANQVAAVLGISRAGAYNLMRSEGFPTLFLGKRMVVPKDKLLAWVDAKVGS